MVQVRLYVKVNCRLCLQAIAVLDRVRRDVQGLHLEVVDAGRDRELWRRYAQRLPVLEVDGSELQSGRISEWSLRNWLAERGMARAAE